VEELMQLPQGDELAKHAPALSLALHELGTNATKYGALSRPEGLVRIGWDARRGILHMRWTESGGPIVLPPQKKGFGTRLLEELVARDLGGRTKLDYNADGVRYSLTAKL
jgi:two-component sensor histidine kinase